MTTIQISYDTPAAAIARVEAMLAETALRDPNWPGADFRVELGDCTCIVDDDSYAAAALLRSVFAAIDGPEDRDALESFERDCEEAGFPVYRNAR